MDRVCFLDEFEGDRKNCKELRLYLKNENTLPNTLFGYISDI